MCSRCSICAAMASLRRSAARTRCGPWRTTSLSSTRWIRPRSRTAWTSRSSSSSVRSCWASSSPDKIMINSLYDIVLWAGSFRNIDLFYQGHYYLRVTLQDSSGKPAQPYSIKGYNLPPNVVLAQQPGFWNPDGSSELYSRPLFLRYFEEETGLNTAVHFRYELPLEDCPGVLTARFQLLLDCTE
jgi:hypothetical protein